MILFLDGCSHYAVAELGQKWTSKTNAFVTWDVLAEGRTDGCIKRTSTSNGGPSGSLVFSPAVTQAGAWTATASGVFGAALKIDDLGAIDGTPGSPSSFAMGDTLFQVQNGIWTIAGVTLNPNGTLTLWQHAAVGGVNTNLGTSVVGVNSGQWAYLEFRWLVSKTVGQFEIRSNGVTILNYTGVLFPDYFPFSPPTETWTSVSWLGSKSTPSPLLVLRACDHYLLDRVASPDGANPNNTFLGDVTIAYIKPNGVGDETNWTPSAGANWECVDEVPPNGDTDYVETTPPGTRDVYAFEDVVGDPKAIHICAYTRKTDEAGASLAPITRQAGTDYDSPTLGVGSTAYDYLLWPQDVNPATNLRWLKTEMDAGQWGPRKVT